MKFSLKYFRITRMRITSKKILLVMFACFEGLFASCQNKITKIEMVNKNPVEYVFKTPTNNLFEAITQKHSFLGLSVMTIKNKNTIPSEILELFLQANNSNDIFLWSLGVYDKSKIYIKKNGDYFDYRVSFYLHIEKLNDSITKVIIKTIEPKIVIGKELIPSPPHMVRKDKTLLVEPSTIEEYKILLEIGRLVGEKDMPPLNLPDKN